MRVTVQTCAVDGRRYYLIDVNRRFASAPPAQRFDIDNITKMCKCDRLVFRQWSEPHDARV